MIEGIKPYPAYKDSGVPWLGDVPEDWGISAFRAVARARKGRQPASLMGHGGGDTGGVPYLSMEFLRSPGNSPSEFAAPQDDLVIADYVIDLGAHRSTFWTSPVLLPRMQARRADPQSTNRRNGHPTC